MSQNERVLKSRPEAETHFGKQVPMAMSLPA